MEDYEIRGVTELFNTWQGEGPRMGKMCTFLRFKKCNLHCEFCDIKHKLENSKECNCNIIEDVYEKIKSTKYLLISGGEPTVYNNQIYKILDYFYKYNILIGIETNGLFINNLLKKVDDLIFNKNNGIPPLFNLEFYWSPKIFSDNSHEGVKYTTLDWFEHQLKVVNNYISDIYIKLNNKFKSVPQIINLYIKVLCSDSLDYENIIKISTKYINNENIYIMAEGVSPIDLIMNSVKIPNLAYKYNVNISSRLHILHVVP